MGAWAGLSPAVKLRMARSTAVALHSVQLTDHQLALRLRSCACSDRSAVAAWLSDWRLDSNSVMSHLVPAPGKPGLHHLIHLWSGHIAEAMSASVWTQWNSFFKTNKPTQTPCMQF